MLFKSDAENEKIVTVAVMQAVVLVAFGYASARVNPFDPGNGLCHKEIAASSFISPGIGR